MNCYSHLLHNYLIPARKFKVEQLIQMFTDVLKNYRLPPPSGQARVLHLLRL